MRAKARWIEKEKCQGRLDKNILLEYKCQHRSESLINTFGFVANSCF